MVNFQYLIEVSCCMAIFWLVFHFLLSKTTFFRLNRAYLLISLVVSLLIPYVEFTTYSSPLALAVIQLPEVIIGNFNNPENGYSINWLLVIYAIGAAITLTLFLTDIIKIVFLQLTPSFNKKGNINIYELEETNQVFSFNNNIFIPSNWQLNKQDKETILKHEQVHIKQNHSADILIINLLKVAFWFNPFVYLYEYSIKMNHEYLADEATILQTEKFEYAQTLLTCVQAQHSNKLLHSFFTKSQLKQRIMMISKNKSTPLNLLRYLSFCIACVVMLGIFSCSKEDVNPNAKTTKAPPPPPPPPPPPAPAPEKAYSLENGYYEDDPNALYAFVKEMPEFPGGQNKLLKYLGSNIKYPKISKDAEIEGKNIVEFVIEKDGSVSNTRIEQGLDKATNAESLRVINAMPNWKPGYNNGKPVRVKYYIPIRYKLE